MYLCEIFNNFPFVADILTKSDSMKRIIITLALLCALAANAANVRWLSTTHDFGAFSEDDGKATALFRFVNDTNEDVVITNVVSTCGCTVPSYSENPIAPGDTAVVEVTYNPIGRPGRFSKQVFVRTTASNERQELKIKGIVIGNDTSVKSRYPVDMGALKLRTGAAMMGKVNPGTGKTGYIDGYNQSQDSLRLSFTEVPKYLQIGTVPEVVAPGDLVSINIYFRGDKCHDWGVVTDSIKVWPSSGEDFYYLPVVCIVEEDFSQLTQQQLAEAPSVSIFGDRIDLGAIPAGSTKPVTAKMQLLNRGKSKLKIRRVFSQDRAITVKAKSMEVKPGKTTDIEVTYDPSSNPDGTVNTRITLITNDPSAPTRTIRVVAERK